MQPLLTIDNLAVAFDTYAGQVQAVRGISFIMLPGEAVGLVGESGCGKSVTAHAIMQLITRPPGRYASGKIDFAGTDLLQLPETALEKIRGNTISMIFQDPMTSLNPVLTVGRQIAEALELHQKLSKRQAAERVVELLELVGIPAAQERSRNYPHQFSGGMRQRAMIAMALACNPRLLLADEPTTALDVTLQAQILDLLKELQVKFNTAILFISHDLGAVAELCSQVHVMYAGKIVESAATADLFANPQHPYTKGLLAAVPRLDSDEKMPLAIIDGQPPNLLQPPTGCPFHPRCPQAMQICTEDYPETIKLHAKHSLACWLQHPAAPKPDRE